MTPWEQETTFRPVPFDPGRGPEPARKPPKRKHNRDSATQPMSKANMCLLAIAALQAAQRTEAAFKTAIVVEAWRANKAAFGLGEKGDDPVAMYLNDVYTLPASLAGLPALSVPAAPVGGLPVGLQLIGNYWQEADLLNTAHAFQQATDWHARAPAGF